MADNESATIFSLHLQLNPSSTSLTLRGFYIISGIRISRHFTTAFTTLICSILHSIRLRFLPSRQSQTISVIALLIALLQLKYQGSDKTSPFSTHSATMLVSVSSTVVYCFAYIALRLFPTSLRIASFARRCLFVSCNAVVASLVSVLLPDIVGPFVYAVFAVISAAELLCLLYYKLVRYAEFLCWGRRFPSQQLLPISSPGLHA